MPIWRSVTRSIFIAVAPFSFPWLQQIAALRFTALEARGRQSLFEGEAEFLAVLLLNLARAPRIFRANTGDVGRVGDDLVGRTPRAALDAPVEQNLLHPWAGNPPFRVAAIGRQPAV